MNTKRTVLASVFALLALASGMYFASPWWSLGNLAQAARAGDKDKLALYVDFPRVRESIGDQANALLMEQGARESDDNPFAPLAALMGGFVVEKLLDTYVTPAGVGRFIDENWQSEPGAEKLSRWEMIQRVRDRVEFEWLSHDHIRLHLKDDGGGEATTALIQRAGLRWRVVDFTIPTGPTASSSEPADLEAAARDAAAAAEAAARAAGAQE